MEGMVCHVVLLLDLINDEKNVWLRYDYDTQTEEL